MPETWKDSYRLFPEQICFSGLTEKDIPDEEKEDCKYVFSFEDSGLFELVRTAFEKPYIVSAMPCWLDPELCLDATLFMYNDLTQETADWNRKNDKKGFVHF